MSDDLDASMKCRICGQQIFPSGGAVSRVSVYQDCRYKCIPCGVGYSNARDEDQRRLIYADYRQNVPAEVRDGLESVIDSALNRRNNDSKRAKFAFETSEDAVTWTVFRYLWTANAIGPALNMSDFAPTALWFWGTRWPFTFQRDDMRSDIEDILLGQLHESSGSLSEPDVIIEGPGRLVFVEVKYRSPNDRKPNYRGFPKYVESFGHLFVNPKDIAGAGYYELTRNWVVGSLLAERRKKKFVLVNLATKVCQTSADGFAASLHQTDIRSFKFVAWEDLIRRLTRPLAPWFNSFIGQRRLAQRAD